VVSGEFLVLINLTDVFCSGLSMRADGGVKIGIVKFVNGIGNL